MRKRLKRFMPNEPFFCALVSKEMRMKAVAAEVCKRNAGNEKTDNLLTRFC